MSDWLIFLAARIGNLHAFNQLVLRYQDTVFRQASWLLLNPLLAEAATTDVFRQAFQAIHQLQVGSLQTWLLRKVTKICFSMIARSSRPLDLTPIIPEQGEVDNIISAWLTAPEALNPTPGSLGDEQSRLMAAIAQLPIELRAAVLLVDIQGLPYLEAALVLELPQAELSSRIAQARVCLRQALVKEVA
jgi:RNA polymerase sigma-70 factor, ECF subfamily